MRKIEKLKTNTSVYISFPASFLYTKMTINHLTGSASRILVCNVVLEISEVSHVLFCSFLFSHMLCILSFPSTLLTLQFCSNCSICRATTPLSILTITVRTPKLATVNQLKLRLFWFPSLPVTLYPCNTVRMTDRLNASQHANFQISRSWLVTQIDIKHLVRARFLITASGALRTLPWDGTSLGLRSWRDVSSRSDTRPDYYRGYKSPNEITCYLTYPSRFGATTGWLYYEMQPLLLLLVVWELWYTWLTMHLYNNYDCSVSIKIFSTLVVWFLGAKASLEPTYVR